MRKMNGLRRRVQCADVLDLRNIGKSVRIFGIIALLVQASLVEASQQRYELVTAEGHRVRAKYHRHNRNEACARVAEKNQLLHEPASGHSFFCLPRAEAINDQLTVAQNRQVFNV
jgi:hypothetical protein